MITYQKPSCHKISDRTRSPIRLCTGGRTPTDGTDGRWRIARKVAEDRVISTVDPQARHVHKNVHSRQKGYKAHVAIEPDTGLFTGAKLTKAGKKRPH
jgi:hypothetical protein